MADRIPEYARTIQRAVAAYNGLIALYQQDQSSSPYFAGCLAQATTKRNGLQERLANPAHLADAFKDTYYQSIDHFLDGHRDEYGPDTPGADPTKALLASQYLAELKHVMDDIIRIKEAQRVQA